MTFAYRESVTPGMLMLALGIGSGLIILLSFIGPFGTRYTLSWNGPDGVLRSNRRPLPVDLLSGGDADPVPVPLPNGSRLQRSRLLRTP